MTSPTSLRTVQTPAGPGPIGGRAILVFYAILGVQLICAMPFMFDIWGEVFALRTTILPWYLEEIIQMLATAGILAGILSAGIYMSYLRRSQRRIAHLDQQIGAVSGSFHSLLQTHFDKWALSRSEAEIAFYAIKGFSNAEIGDLRGTSAATVKSQMNAIYRKSGIANRQQLISFLVEELLAGVAPGGQPETAEAA